MTDPRFGGQGIAALGGPEVMLIPIVWLDIEGDPVRAWGGIGDLSWGGQIWTGIGQMGDIGPIKTGVKDAMPGLSLSLNGLPSNLLADAKAAAYRGRRGYVWLGLFDPDTLALLDGDAALIFAGEISAMNLSSGPGEARITVEIESRMMLLSRQMTRYRTQADQARRHAGDRFFEFVPAVLNKTIYWGLEASKAATGGGAGKIAGSDSGGFNPAIKLR
ncbi:hypothetical protein [Pseudokordiimonas caeni]|uniref:hypothetical protein n=1 Tax=Pseudokordiimonas caeni TaxID=2997908 RepID=UPI002811F8E1|nr:hypothetical protein [Pseudokordiimonas caeni]